MKFVRSVLTVDKPNKNGRIYPKSLVENWVNNFKESFGTIGYPQDSKITLSEASHKINRIEIKNDELFVEAETLVTPNGIKLDNLLEKDLDSITLRSFGFGNLENNIIQDDYELVTFCAVPTKDAA